MRQLAVLPLFAVFLLTSAAAAQTAMQDDNLPRPPCAPGERPYPAYATEGAPPAVKVWQNVALPDDSCFAALTGAMNSVAALAGRFRYGGGPDGLAARFGALSQTVGQLYWSTSEQDWRVLVSEAFALSGKDTSQKRPDFAGAEVRSGETLHFAQNDTRSTGLNLYRLRALAADEDRLVIEVVNESAIAFTFVTLFHEEGLLSLYFLERQGGDLWAYYALAAVRDGSVAGHTKSLVNRTVAFYRFLRGVPGDAGEPLAE